MSVYIDNNINNIPEPKHIKDGTIEYYNMLDSVLDKGELIYVEDCMGNINLKIGDGKTICRYIQDLNIKDNTIQADMYDLKNSTDRIDNITNDLNIRLNEITNKVNRTVTMIHNCGNCGARLEVKENHPVFHCKYCGTTYVIGPVQRMSTYLS